MTVSSIFRRNMSLFSGLWSAKDSTSKVSPLARRQLQQTIQWFYLDEEKNLDQVPAIFIGGLLDSNSSIIAYQHFLGRIMHKHPTRVEGWLKDILTHTLPAEASQYDLLDSVLQAAKVSWSKEVKEALGRVLQDPTVSPVLPKEFLQSATDALEKLQHPIDFVGALSVGPPLTLRYLESVLESPENDWIIPTCWIYFTATLDPRPLRVLLKLATQPQAGVLPGHPNEQQLRELHGQLRNRAIQSLKDMAYLHQPQLGQALETLLTTDKFILKDPNRQKVIKEVLESVEEKTKAQGAPKEGLVAPWF